LTVTDSRVEAEIPGPRLSGHARTALVTGGTDGIGKAIAREFALAGVVTIIVGRDAKKGQAAEHELRRATRNADVHFVSADLGLISDIDRLVEQLAPRLPNLEFLVHCAGVVQGQYHLTAEGVESNFAVDYLGRFALTEALLPALMAGGLSDDPARILVIGGAAQNGKIYFGDVNLNGRFSIMRVVAQFCEANDVFVIELARQLAAAQPPSHVTVTTLKVGAVRTNIRRQFPLWMKLLVPVLIDPFLSTSPQQIAASALRLLLGPEHLGISGALFRHIKKFKHLTPGPQTADPAQGRALWDFSRQRIAQIRAARGGQRA
jgi:NAD(P)-dependent dehydrogenase (short-subunit alcohol dehydrogenase family)